MAANSAPRMVLPVNSVAAAEISAANTARDGTGTVPTIFTAGSEGSLIELIRVVAEGTTTAGMVRIFLHNGATFFLYDEIPVSAITPSATVEVFQGEIVPSKPLVLPTGWTLRASTHNAEVFNVFVTGGNY